MSDSIHVSLKHCPRCNRDLPATKQYFHSHKKYADGLYYQCKQCRTEMSQKWKEQPPIPDGRKKCITCQQILPATREYFYADPRNRICGLRSQCISCTAYLGMVKSQRPIPQYQGTKICTQCKKSKPATPDYFHVNKRMSGGLNPCCNECYSAYYKHYSHLHPDVVKARRDRRRTHLRDNEGEYTPEQIENQLKRQKHKCYYCSKKFERIKRDGKCKYVYHIDHTFPLSRVSGIPANGIDYLVLACPTCNWRKGDKFPWEWPEGGRLL